MPIELLNEGNSIMKSHKLQVSNPIPETGFLRLHQIIGQRPVTEEEAKQNRLDAELAKKSGYKPINKPKRARPSTPAIIPISRSQWYAGIKTGKYPKCVKLGARISAWRASDIHAVIEQLDGYGNGDEA